MSETEGRRPAPANHRIKLPGFLLEDEIGAGDLLKRATASLGIRPCGPCGDRARRLNGWLAFYGRGRPS